MARLTDEQKSVITNEIRDHILIEGPRNWDGLMAKYPDVSRATFWRLVKETRERMENQAAGEGPGAVREIQKRIRERVATPDQIKEKVKAHLPVAPSPAVVAAAPQDAMEAFNFFAFFNQIVEDSMLARNQNIKVNPDGTTKIVNPMMFDRNLSQRRNLLNSYTQAVDTIYNMERIRDLYDMIIEAIGEASPEIQQVVLAKLRNLNNRVGMTMAAKP